MRTLRVVPAAFQVFDRRQVTYNGSMQDAELKSHQYQRSSQGAAPAVSVALLTVSDTRTLETDRSGAAMAEALRHAGHEVVARILVADDLTAIRSQVQQWMADPAVQVIITTGGTGITRRDVTPEAIEPLITKRLDGFGELFRMLSYQEIGPATLQSRALGAVCGSTPVFVLPGSTNAVELAMTRILLPQLDRRTKPCNLAMLFDRL